jgi:hypothetical protein
VRFACWADGGWNDALNLAAMKCALLGLVALGPLLICPAARGAEGAFDKATHKEIEPIRIPLGEDGHLKTIAMDRKGNLLVGVSWAPQAGAGAGRTNGSLAHGPPPAALGGSAPMDSATVRARLEAAFKVDSAEVWDRFIQDIRPESFRAAVGPDPATRRDIMSRLPERVRQHILQGLSGRGPGSPGGSRDGGRGMVPGVRGGLQPRLSTGDEGYTFALKVVDPAGKVLSTWPMTEGLQPKMIHGCDDGRVYVAGGGKVAEFSEEGRLVKMLDTDKVCGQMALASGLFVTDKEVFLALGMGNSTLATEDVYRLKRDLTEPKKIITRQFGCCSHIDLEVVNGELLVAENSRHRVNRFDFDGKLLGTWGRRDRQSLEGFAACCNPCNTDIGPGNVLFTAESGVGRVKKYTPTGEFLGLAGYVDTAKFDQGSQFAALSCYIPIEVSKDASRIYVMDVRANVIRVLAKAE